MCSSAQWWCGRGEERKGNAGQVWAAPDITPVGNKALQLSSSWQGSKAGKQERRWEPGKTLAVCLFWRGWHLQTWWQRLNIKVWEEPTATLIWMCVFIFFFPITAVTISLSTTPHLIPKCFSGTTSLNIITITSIPPVTAATCGKKKNDWGDFNDNNWNGLTQ